MATTKAGIMELGHHGSGRKEIVMELIPIISGKMELTLEKIRGQEADIQKINIS